MIKMSSRPTLNALQNNTFHNNYARQNGKTFFYLIVTYKESPKWEILSLFTYPRAISNLYEIVSSAEHNTRYFREHL